MNPDGEAVCPICGGMGFIRYDVPIDHPHFGKLFRCPGNHGDMEEQRHEKLRKLSNLDVYADKRFDNFVTTMPHLTPQQQSTLINAYNVAQSFAQQPKGWLLLQGTYGCGKTHLAAAIGNYRIGQGDSILFITTPDLLDHLRSAFAPTSEIVYDDLFDRIRNAPLLILDDLGAENPSSWAREKLFQLLNHRYSRALPTVITTNTDLDALDPRVRSRVLDSAIVKHYTITAPDYRTFMPDQRNQVSYLHLYAQMTFDTFDVRSGLNAEQSRKLRGVLDDVKRYSAQPQGWLILMGQHVGCGKTHLAAAVAHDQANYGRHDVTFITAPDLLDHLRMTFAPDAPSTFDKRFHTIRTTPLLILDDLGVESPSSWAREKLFQLLDYRYVAQLPTVITTAKQWKDLDERLLIRLADQRISTVVEIEVPDYATRIKRQR